MNAGGTIEAVVFGLGDEKFALPVGTVREILDHRETFRVPNGPAWLLGLIEVREKAVPMVDLRVRLGLAPAPVTLMTRILVIDIAAETRILTLGLVVDRVMDVSSFFGDAIEGVPDIGMRWSSDYIKGVIRQASGFILLVDIARIFARDDAVLLPLHDQAA